MIRIKHLGLLCQRKYSVAGGDTCHGEAPLQGCIALNEIVVFSVEDSRRSPAHFQWRKNG